MLLPSLNESQCSKRHRCDFQVDFNTHKSTRWTLFSTTFGDDSPTKMVGWLANSWDQDGCSDGRGNTPSLPCIVHLNNFPCIHRIDVSSGSWLNIYSHHIQRQKTHFVHPLTASFTASSILNPSDHLATDGLPASHNSLNVHPNYKLIHERLCFTSSIPRALHMHRRITWLSLQKILSTHETPQ